MNKKGFTFIEIIAIIVILSVLLIIIVPNFSKFISKNKEIEGQQVENILIKNLQAYNAEKNEQIWSKDSKSGQCYIMSIEELLHYNEGINLGNCLINGYDALVIQKTDNGYGYYANITCSPDFKDNNKHILTDENTDNVSYRSNNEYSCSNLN